MQIARIDIYIYKLDQHYRLRGLEETPGRLPGTDYFFEPHWRQAYSRKVEACLLKLTTDSGLVGWGEAQAPLLPETAGTILRGLVGPFLLGRDPLAREVLYDHLYHINNIRGHESGFMLDAIAAADIALWDIAGKHYGTSVCELLGGPFSADLTAYVSGLRQPTLKEQCRAARAYMDEGFAGIKLFLGRGLRDDARTAREIRAAVGPDARLFCDFLWRYRVDEAIRLGRILEGEGFEWIEAPLAPEDLESHRRLRRTLGVPIAVGETMRTAFEFRPWIETRALEIVQPDVVRTGIGEARNIAALARVHRLPVAPHIGVCSGIGMAATWQVAAALPNFLIQEFQLELTRNAGRILKTPLEAKAGRVCVPSGPGLGVEVDEDAVRGLSTDHWTLDAKDPV